MAIEPMYDESAFWLTSLERAKTGMNQYHDI